MTRYKPETLFPGQQQNETICLVTRQHWAVLLGKMVPWLILLAVYLLADFAVNYVWLNSLEAIWVELFNVFKAVYLLFLLLGGLIVWTIYYLNMQVITNERIVDITQSSLLRHTMSELHLNQVQDVTAEIHGLPENILNYGDVFVQTAGETQRFVFDKVPNPNRVTKIILDLHQKTIDQQKSAS